VVPSLVQIIGAETIGDHRYVSGIQLIGDGNIWVCPEIVIQQIASHRTGAVAGACLGRIGLFRRG
jgi:hypothetical protein